MDTNTLAVVITVGGTIIVGAFTFVQQMNRNAAQRIAESKAASVEASRLQDEIETRLWARVKGELDSLTTQLEAERVSRRDLEMRVNVLENENRRLQTDNQALVAELAKYTGRRL